MEYLQEGLHIGREIGDQWTVGLCLFQMGQVLQTSAAYGEARECYDESLSAFRALGDRHAEQMSLDHSGYLARMLGDYEQARHHHRESLSISQEKGDRLGTAGSLNNLGLVARDLGDYEGAERFLRQALALREEVGHQWSIAITLENLGDVALARGRLDEARRWYTESLDVGRAGETRRPTVPLRGLAEAHCAEGDHAQASHYLRDALQSAVSDPVPYLPELLMALVAASHLACRTGEKVWAAELLSYVVQHPASTARVRARAERLLGEMGRKLPPEAIETAGERYRDKPVGEVVETVLQSL
jgi:tetratricopeptide (TPR) repeat protein